MNGNYVSKQGGVLLNLTAYFGQYPGGICRANDEESLPDKHTAQQLPTNLHLAISLPPSLEFQQNGRDQFPILMPMDSRHRAPQGHFTRQKWTLTLVRSPASHGEVFGQFLVQRRTPFRAEPHLVYVTVTASGDGIPKSTQRYPIKVLDRLPPRSAKTCYSGTGIHTP
jgi:hypothetical protein